MNSGFDNFMKDLGFTKMEVDALRSMLGGKIKLGTDLNEASCGGCGGCGSDSHHYSKEDLASPFEDIIVQDTGRVDDSGTLTINAVGTSSFEYLQIVGDFARDLAEKFESDSRYFQAVMNHNGYESLTEQDTQASSAG